MFVMGKKNETNKYEMNENENEWKKQKERLSYDETDEHEKEMELEISKIKECKGQWRPKIGGSGFGGQEVWLLCRESCITYYLFLLAYA